MRNVEGFANTQKDTKKKVCVCISRKKRSLGHAGCLGNNSIANSFSLCPYLILLVLINSLCLQFYKLQIICRAQFVLGGRGARAGARAPLF